MEKSGSWPTSSTSSPWARATSAGSNGPPVSACSSWGSTPSGSQARRAVSAARTLELVRQASSYTPIAASAAPAARAWAAPRS